MYVLSNLKTFISVSLNRPKTNFSTMLKNIIIASYLCLGAVQGFATVANNEAKSEKNFNLNQEDLKDSLEKMAKRLERNLVIDTSKMPVYNVVKDFKLDNTGNKLITAQFQRAIDSCTKNGPARFLFPKGTYLTGTIILRSGVHIELAHLAKIIGSVDAKDYPVIYPEYKANTDLQVNKSLFYAEKVENISFTGKGMIDFRGDNAVYLNTGNNDTRRPFGLRIISSKNIYVAGLMLWNSPQWMQHYLDCDNVMIENLSVFNHAHQNNDGIDIDGCRNVYIRNCRVDSDDDGICLKSNGPAKCENVLVENCIVATHCNALKLGTETTGGFKNIMYRNCKVVQSVTGYHHVNGAETTRTAITLIISDGGRMENVWFDNITAEDCVSPLFVTLGNRSRKYTETAAKPGIGTIENILISNFHAIGAGPMPSSITGLNDTHKIKNITLRNITLDQSYTGQPEDRTTDVVKVLQRVKAGYPSPDGWGNLNAAGLYCGYVDGLTLQNVVIKTTKKEPRKPLVIENSQNIKQLK